METELIRVQGTSETATRTVVHARDFSFVIDEPPEEGGEDRGPSPVEYLLSALVGCLNVVAHLVASEMGITIRDLDIDAEGKLNPARLYGKSEEGRPGMSEIMVTLRVDSDADEAALVEWRKTIEKRCPVFDNISSSTPLALNVDSMLPAE